jgi:hypothetical protein
MFTGTLAASAFAYPPSAAMTKSARSAIDRAFALSPQSPFPRMRTVPTDRSSWEPALKMLCVEWKRQEPLRVPCAGITQIRF